MVNVHRLRRARGPGRRPACWSRSASPSSSASTTGSGSDAASAVIGEDAARSLGQLAASRAERDADADRGGARRRPPPTRPSRSGARPRRPAAERAAAEAAARAGRRPSGPPPQAAAAPTPHRRRLPHRQLPSGSYQDYALAQLGGDSGEFSCLESLWGKESGWNPNAQNPSSTAYGIPQFLDSTWAGTGIAKTSDGYRQIDAGLIYIDQRYGSPCGAWGALAVHRLVLSPTVRRRPARDRERCALTAPFRGGGFNGSTQHRLVDHRRVAGRALRPGCGSRGSCVGGR